MRYVLPLLAALAVAGCANQLPTAGISCPPLKEYDRETQAQAAVELDAAGPVIQQMITDYSKTRDAIRACEMRRADTDR